MRAEKYWAVVPVKAFRRAKTRLDDILGPQEREQLSRAMLRDVLAVTTGCGSLAGVFVVTNDAEVASVATAFGASILHDADNAGPARAVTAAAQALAAEGHAGMVGIMADVPLIRPAEIERLLTTHGSQRGVTLAPARDGYGTNAVVCSPPDLMPLSFGDDSLASHLRSAMGLGIDPKIVNLEGIALDIDVSPDLASFLEHGSKTETTRYLAASGVAERLAEAGKPRHLDLAGSAG